MCKVNQTYHLILNINVNKFQIIVSPSKNHCLLNFITQNWNSTSSEVNPWVRTWSEARTVRTDAFIKMTRKSNWGGRRRRALQYRAAAASSFTFLQVPLCLPNTHYRLPAQPHPGSPFPTDHRPSLRRSRWSAIGDANPHASDTQYC